LPLKPRNLKKLASLSAVGAGALAITADKAEAGTITTVQLPTPVVVGFAPGDTKGTSFSFKAFSNTFRFGFSRSWGNSAFGYAFFRSVFAWASASHLGAASTGFRFAKKQFPVPHFSASVAGLKIFHTGSTWAGSGTGSDSKVAVGARFWAGSGASTTHFVFGNPSFGGQFALFEFGPAAAPGFGWVELSFLRPDAFGPACASPTCGDPNHLGPELTITAYGYDTSGAPLPAGAGIPEPDTLAATGLAALVLGAAGMRRWRRNRPA
jgi:hypothetical protein